MTYYAARGGCLRLRPCTHARRFLLDQGDMLLFMLDGTAGGVQRLLSVQEAYDLMVRRGAWRV